MAGPAVRRAAVLGHPIAHSLSPTLHRAAYAALGLDDWRYDAVDVTEDALPAFVAGLGEQWAGLSLTMPLKQTVLPLLEHVEPLAQVVGAVNTVLVQGAGAARTLVGANTDVHGLVVALREGLAGRPVGTAVVLGAGATASSTLAALAELGCTAPLVLVRSLARSGALMRSAHRMGVEPVFRSLEDAPRAVVAADVVVSTLPPRAADDLAAALDGRPTGVLLDVAYDPRPTALHARWTELGGTAVGGERMLLHQAAEQVRLMTGRPAPLAAMDAALEACLAD
ncbi:shikimate dehydrogenase [Cellulomonas gilvus]|uniref:Shikimate dehydrogenase substrate binding domain protein n=1 Tax=Cellulomonas gilvus (strain ATCC 13127 / NRRL B-14078) TaxID=593907 RepID=F8A516_CELGA|nr:shikimate dehydrogenase [Cellulomonas gilvus]AEI12119.1 Shikimate dehydrogenase substrate binding domain protein [Cellulomonas gilvus ATCC 13127]